MAAQQNIILRTTQSTMYPTENMLGPSTLSVLLFYVGCFMSLSGGRLSRTIEQYKEPAPRIYSDKYY